MDSKESSGKPVRSLVSIAESAFGEILKKLDDPSAWERCPGCDAEFLAGQIRPGTVCVLCKQKEGEKERLRARIEQACGGERALRLFTREAFRVKEGNREAYEAVNRFNYRMDNLMLWGPCGTGKSHLAAILGRENANYDGMVIFSEPAPLLRSLRGLSVEEERARIDELVKVPVLILDDLGIEKDTEFAISTISEIVSHRLKADRNGLVVTSNLSLDALAAKLNDDRLTSRLAGMCQVIELKGADYRLQGNA